VRAERRAAPKPARVPSGDRPMYPSDEGFHHHLPTTSFQRFVIASEFLFM